MACKCKYCDPANEIAFWNRFTWKPVAFISYGTGPNMTHKQPEIVARSLAWHQGEQIITGSVDVRIPAKFCPWCGEKLGGDA